MQIPTAIVTLPKLGRICFADAGFEAKIQCADMDGNKRQVNCVCGLPYDLSNLDYH